MCQCVCVMSPSRRSRAFYFYFMSLCGVSGRYYSNDSAPHRDEGINTNPGRVPYQRYNQQRGHCDSVDSSTGIQGLQECNYSNDLINDN